MYKGIIIFLPEITVKMHYLSRCLTIPTSDLIILICTKINLNHCGACSKWFRSGNRKRMLSASRDLWKFVFVHAVLDSTQWIDTTKETNILLCNYSYLPFCRKMSASIDNEITSMNLGDTGNNLCQESLRTKLILRLFLNMKL